MKLTLTLAAAAIAAIAALPALANGILPPPPAVPPAVVPAAADWTGAYVGGSLAYYGGSGRFCDDNAAYALCANPFDGLPEPEPTGGMLGITAGYDWQAGNIVYGIAGDLMFGNLSDGVPGTGGATSFGCGGLCTFEVNTVAMLRGRIGYAMGDLLPYVTAGVAMTQGTSAVPGDPADDVQFTSTVLGVGADYMLSDTMSAGFDVLHLFGGDDNDYDPTTVCGICGIGNYNATMARVTVAYRF